MDRQAGAQFIHRGDDHLTELEENLELLNLDIPDPAIDDLPMRYQRHTARVPGYFS